MKSRTVIIVFYIVLLAGLFTWAGSAAVDMRWEYNKLKRTEAELHRKLSEAKAKLEEQKIILHRLRNDPGYVERVLRDRNYAKPDDLIFMFERTEDSGRRP